MRILHLTTFLQGGAGLVIAALASAQRMAGHDVVVMTSATPEPGYGNYPAHLQTLERVGVQVYAVDSSFKREAAANSNVAAFVEERLGGAAGFDIIHTHAAVPSAIALGLSERTARRVPVLQTMHGWGIAKSPEQQQADVTTLNQVNCVVVPAPTSAVLLETLGVRPAQIRVVPYGVQRLDEPPAEGHELRTAISAWQASGRVVVCCAGTIGERKNQHVLVDAMAEIAGALCLFVGEGDTASLETRARALGVEDRVRFCGYRADARHIVAAADYFVLPSLSEGQPLSILQAFCDGVPAVVSAIPELSELVADGSTGFLFNPTDPADLARAVSAARRLTPEGRRDVVMRARALYESRFTIERMLEGYMAAYDDLRTSEVMPR